MRIEQSTIQDYINQTFAPEDELLTRVRAVGESLYPGMQVSAGEGQLLHVLLRMIGAKHVLEIGSFVGYSAIHMLRAMPEDGTLWTLERNPEHAKYAREHLSAFPQARVMEGDALEIVKGLDGPFVTIFFDGEKRCYLKYLAATAPKLRVGGLLIADNTLLFGAVVGEATKQAASPEAQQVMRAFNAQLGSSPQWASVMIPTPEGLTVAMKLHD